MRSAARDGKPATYADIEALPEHLVGEIIDGELVVSPRPGLAHVNAASGLGVLLGGPFQYGLGGPGGWWILDEPELHLDANVLVPDLAGWRVERMGSLPPAAAAELAPDWACEVLSPSTETTDRARKLAVYARHRVAHVWLVHPINRTLEVLRLDGDTWRIVSIFTADDSPLRAEPFDAVELPFARLFAPPHQPEEGGGA